MLKRRLTLCLRRTFQMTRITRRITKSVKRLIMLTERSLLPYLSRQVKLVPRMRIRKAIMNIRNNLSQITSMINLLETRKQSHYKESNNKVLNNKTRINCLQMQMNIKNNMTISSPLSTTVSRNQVRTTIGHRMQYRLNRTLLKKAVMRGLQFTNRAIKRRGLVKTRTSHMRGPKRRITSQETTITLRHNRDAFQANQMIRLPDLHTFENASGQMFNNIQQRMSTELMLFKFNRLTLNKSTKFRRFKLTINNRLITMNNRRTMAINMRNIIVSPITIIVTNRVRLTNNGRNILKSTIGLMLISHRNINRNMMLLKLLRLFRHKTSSLQIRRASLHNNINLLNRDTLLALINCLMLLNLRLIGAMNNTNNISITLSMNKFRLLYIQISTRTLRRRQPYRNRRGARRSRSNGKNRQRAPNLRHNRDTRTSKHLTFRHIKTRRPSTRRRTRSNNRRNRSRNSKSINVCNNMKNANST